MGREQYLPRREPGPAAGRLDGRAVATGAAGARDSAAFTVENTPDAGNTQRINYNHSMPSDGGFSWNMAWANQSKSSDYQQGTLGWRNNNIELQGGGYGEGT